MSEQFEKRVIAALKKVFADESDSTSMDMDRNLLRQTTHDLEIEAIAFELAGKLGDNNYLKYGVNEVKILNRTGYGKKLVFSIYVAPSDNLNKIREMFDTYEQGIDSVSPHKIRLTCWDSDFEQWLNACSCGQDFCTCTVGWKSSFRAYPY